MGDQVALLAIVQFTIHPSFGDTSVSEQHFYQERLLDEDKYGSDIAEGIESNPAPLERRLLRRSAEAWRRAILA